MSDTCTPPARRLALLTVAIAGISLLVLGLPGCSQDSQEQEQPQTLDELRAEAEAGDAGAQWMLGSRYEMGMDVPQDGAEAIAWYLKAAEQNFPSALASLGEMYKRGRGVPQDIAEAAAWYCRAAESMPVESYVAECEELGDAASRSKWHIRSSTNPLDDSVTVTAHRDADSDSGVGRFGVEAATLIARCRSNTTNVYIAWGEFMDTDDSFVTVRTVGDAYSDLWGVSTDYDATFAPHPIPLLREVAEAERVVVRATPYGESPRTLIWELDADDTREAIEQIAEACNWALPDPID